ncbi:DUF3953 domain-containing protein [Bacillus sp. BP-3]|uniref:DUF3953 domain-containing protein n=1 Tax=Bacillus sp. BP-3 TaxID=3022773 RepID=UPI002330AFB6|nr:DUF3953 domain-containing protein [Bacillus sp. BP-3]MDC2865158.1 DUF3953 domain-containing protein [Bacillus sp. BP-3]
MLKILRITFSIITLLLGVFGFFTDNNLFILPCMLISLGLMCVISSIAEFKKQQTSTGILLFLTGAFAIYVPLSQFFH